MLNDDVFAGIAPRTQAPTSPTPQALPTPRQMTAPAPAQDQDELFKDIPAREHPLESIYRNLPNNNPDQAAQIVTLAQKSGQPEAFVEEHLADVQTAVDAPDVKYWQDLAKRAPATAKYLEDPRRMAVAHDDIEGLAAGERILTGLGQVLSLTSATGRARLAKQVTGEAGRGLAGGALQTRVAELGWRQMLQTLTTGTHNTALDEELTGLEARLQEETKNQPKGFSPVYFAAQQLPNMALMARKGLERGLMGAGVFAAGAAVLGQAGPQAAAPEELATVPASALMGLTAGGRLGAGEAAMMLEAGAAYREFIALRDRAGNPVNPRLAAGMALAVGAANAGLEYLSLAALLRTIPGGQKLLGVFGKTSLTATPAERVKRAAVNYLESVGTEVVTELGQESVAAAGGEAVKVMSGQDFEPADRGQILDRVLSVAGPAAQASMLMGLPGTIATAMIDQSRVQESGAAVDQGRAAYQALGDQADRSKLMQRMPDAYREHLAAATANGPVEHLYIPAQAFTEYCAAKGVDPAAVAEQLGVGALYQEAQKDNGDIQIPTADWVVKSRQVAESTGLNLYQDLAEDVKWSAEEFTPRQKAEADKGLEKALKAAADKAVADNPQLEAERTRVYELMLQELLTAGRPEKEARPQAQVFAHMAAITAARIQGGEVDAVAQDMISRVIGVPDIQRAEGDLAQAAADLQERTTVATGTGLTATPEGYVTLHRVPSQNDSGEIYGRLYSAPREGSVEVKVDPRDVTATQLPGAWLVKGRLIEDADGFWKNADRIGQRRFAPGMTTLLTGPTMNPLTDEARAMALYQEAGNGTISNMDNVELNEILKMDEDKSLPRDILGNIIINAEITATRKRTGNHEPFWSVSSMAESIGRDNEFGTYEDAKKYLQDKGFTVPESMPEVGEFNLYGSFLYEKSIDVIHKKAKALINKKEKILNEYISESKDVYVRYGHLPEGGKSKNHADGKPEAGVSVYSAKMGKDGKVILTLNTPQEYSGNIALRDRDLYLIEGEKVGIGSDGEPVIKNAREIKKIKLASFESIIKLKIKENKANEFRLYQAALPTESQEFKAWFGDSKVVDENGKPLVVYHGTGNSFEEFAANERGIFFTDDPQTASLYSEYTDKEAGEYPNVMPVYLKMENPLVINRAIMEEMAEMEEEDPDEFAEKFRQSSSRERKTSLEYYAFQQKKGIKYDGMIIPYDLMPAEKNENGVVWKDRVSYVVFKPDQIKSVNNRGTFDPNNPNILAQGPAGAYDPATRRMVLSLKAANASTFLHEMAHAWLTAVQEYVADGRADEGLRQDVAAIRVWLGAKEGETLDEKQQEKFAYHFEVYLREGQAPKEELRGAFARFRRWLMRIYRSLTDVGRGVVQVSEISPEIRSIMGRMLASEEEVAFAERRSGMMREIDLAGVDEATLQDLEKLRAKAHEEAVNLVMRDQIKPLTADEKKAREKERREFTVTAKADVDRRPEFLAEADLRQMLGPKYREIAKRYAEEGKFSRKEDIAFTSAADAYGFESNEALARLIADLPKKADMVKQLVDQRMNAKYPEVDREQMAEEAYKAVHDERQLEIMALEQEIMNAMAQQRTQIMRRQAFDRLEAARIKAREIVGQMSLKQLASPARYMTAEQNAAIQFGLAIQRKDFKAAADWKQRQLINHALALQVIRARRDAERVLAQIGEFRTKKKDQFKDQETFNQVASLLARFGFGVRNDYNPADRTESLSVYMTRMDAYFKSDDPEATQYNMPDWIRNGEDVQDYMAMPVERLYELRDAVRNLSHLANMVDKFFILSNKLTIEQMASQLVAAADQQVNGRRREKQVQTALDKLLTGIENARYSLLMPETIMDALDGWEENGAWRPLKRMINRQADQESQALTQALQKLASINGKYSKQELADIYTKRIEVPEWGAVGDRAITKETLLSILLNLGNEGNRDRLMAKPPEGFEPVFEWNRANMVTVMMSIRQVLERHLGEKDYEFAQNVWDWIDSYWPESKALHKRVTGFVPGKVDAMPLEFILPDGKVAKLRGGYYPLVADPRGGARQLTRAQADQPLHTEANPGFVAQTRQGHLKARTGGNYKVALTLDTIPRHVSNVIHDIYFRELVLDLRRLMASETIFEGVKRNLGMSAYEVLRQYVSSIAVGGRQDRTIDVSGSRDIVSWIPKIYLKIQSNAVLAFIALKLSILQQNLSNAFLYGGAVPEYDHGKAWTALVTRGLFDYWPKILGWAGSFGQWREAVRMREFVWQRSQYMRDRAEKPDVTLSEFKNVFMRKQPGLREFALALMGWTDDLTAIPIWIDAYTRGLEETGKSDAAVEFADSIIRRVAGSPRKYDVAPIIRSSEGMVRIFVPLYSFFNTQYNRFERELGRLGKDPVRNVPGFLGFVGAQIGFIVASTMLAGYHPREDADDDERRKWWALQFARNYVAYVPFARDIVTFTLDRAMGMPSTGYRMSVLNTVVDQAGRAAGAIGKEWSGEGDGEIESILEPLTRLASLTTGVPDVFNSIFWNAYNVWNDGMDVIAEDLWRRRPKRER